MLEFWFDPAVSIAKKLFLFILIVVVAAVLYIMQPLDLTSILLFSATGIIFLICRYLKIQFAQHNPTGLLYRLFTWLPVACILALVFKNLQTGDILLPGAQGIAFMALTVCVFSPFSLFNQRNSQAHN